MILSDDVGYTEEKIFNSEDEDFIDSNEVETNSEAESPIQCTNILFLFKFLWYPKGKKFDESGSSHTCLITGNVASGWKRLRVKRYDYSC